MPAPRSPTPPASASAALPPTQSTATPALAAAARRRTSSSSILSSHAVGTAQQQPATMPSIPTSSTRLGRGGTPSSNALSAKRSLKAVDGDKSGRPSSKDGLVQKMKKQEEPPRPNKSEEQLKTLKSDFDGLRGHLTCKICDRLLYQPYIISCGHTYCYSCLCTWFVNNKARKTCPDCRAVVTQPPAPAYLIRDMVNVFIGRHELIPSGETIEQHTTWQREEADTVQQDKENQDPRTGGLFKGCFRPPRLPAPSIRALRDVEDGVDRCPLCQWELEDGECAQCGVFFDENGELTWGDSFTGFSDLDEMSERDEELDGELEMEDDFGGFDEPMEGWQNYMENEDEHHSFMMRRFLEHGIPPHAFMPRRRLTHSEAGSRRSYSQSIVSDMYTDEMDTVEEEDEDGMDEDSSMNDFIDDEEENNPESNASSTPGQTPQPTNPRSSQGRARRIVESEPPSSSASSAIEEEDEDEEDEGPIRRGQRSREQTRLLNRANGSREPPGPPSSTSTEESHEQELDEDTQALLRADGWMLQHDGPDEEMDEDDDDSDGGRTTVGWDATAISNDRVRMGGSLTPTADRPRPNGTIRPPSRTGNPRFMDASRGLRRRSSVISPPNVNYEDGEADDDDSDMDQDGDITMAMNALRQRRSRAQLRNSIGLSVPNATNRFPNRGLSQGDAIDLDTDDNSDNSQAGRRQGAPRARTDYDPRISWMFADHQRALQEFQRAGSARTGQLLDLDIEPRSTTPLARPRTSNRNRPSPSPQFSPFMAPVPPRIRTPLMDNTLNSTMAGRGLTSPPRRVGPSPLHRATTPSNNPARADRAPSMSSTSDASVVLTPSTSGTTTPVISQSVNLISQEQTAATVDMIDRPPSRVSARPTSAAGRRNSAGFSPVYPSFPHTNVGLNMQAAFLQNQRFVNNPWARFVRPRTSRPALRDQSSTATLRPTSSRINLRDNNQQQQGIRTQSSRANLQHQPSRRRLNNQASTRTLRASEHARPPQSPGLSAGPSSPPTARPMRLAPDERENRARELVNDRMRALGGYQPSTNPVRTNPFTQTRRPSLSSDVVPQISGNNNSSHHVRSNSNESIISINSSTTPQMPPSSPSLGRRRSSRNMTTSTAPVPPAPAPGLFTSPVTMYTNNYMRPRPTLTNPASPYDSPLHSTPQRMSPMVAASGLLI